MKRFGFLDKVEGYLKQAGMEVRLFENVEPDPSVETVMRGAAAMREFEPDWIVAMGGGSPIDAAKAMWAFYEYPEVTFEDLITPVQLPDAAHEGEVLRHSVHVRHCHRGHRFRCYYRLCEGYQVSSGGLQHHTGYRHCGPGPGREDAPEADGPYRHGRHDTRY